MKKPASSISKSSISQTAQKAEQELKRLANKEIAKQSARFFKTGPGEYGEGDTFYGIRVPDIRKVAKQFTTMPMNEVERLLSSPVHEARLLSLLILVRQYEKGDTMTKENIFAFYKKNAKRINNWDLVDSSAHKIVGAHLFERDRSMLYHLAKSKNLWERRIAIISTLFFISKNDLQDTFNICEILLADKEDLMHKACGWMLREAGKRDRKRLEIFLDKHVRHMPRTMLRYAIEKFPEKKRKAYLKK